MNSKQASARVSIERRNNASPVLADSCGFSSACWVIEFLVVVSKISNILKWELKSKILIHLQMYGVFHTKPMTMEVEHSLFRT